MYNENTLSSPSKLWNRSYILVILISTMSAFSFYMVATILSKYLVGIGTTITLAGIIVGLFSLTSLFSRPFCGLMVDRLNNVKLLMWSNVLMAIGLLGFAFTTSMPLIIFFRICSGLGFAVGSTVQVALIISFIPKDKTGEGIGYMGISQLIGSACAPAVGLAIAESVGMKAAFIAAAALPVMTCVFLLFLKNLQHAKPSYEKRKIAFRDFFEPKALPFTIPYSTLSFVNGIIASYLVLFADELGIGGISIYFTVYAVSLFLIRPLAGKLMDAKGLKYTVFPGMIITAISMFMLGISHALWFILLTCVLRAIGQGAAQPSLQAGCINHIGRDRTGVATSTYFLGGDVGQGVGPMVGGAILGLVAGLQGYQFVFNFCGYFIIVAMVYFYFISKKEKY
ncbi:MAG TPA: MFS transporter [Anaerolineaceae bacterium]|nr:MFS transporter [Anaerolineaceae bacterium]